MPYSNFTFAKAKKDFNLIAVEGGRFLPQIEPIPPSARLQAALEDLPWAIAVGSERAKSESIVYPVLQEVRRILNFQVSLFSGRDFTVAPEKGLNGYVDYLISRSVEQLEIEAPIIVLAEAKRDNLNEGIGQCIAEMVAAQQFNQTNEIPISTIYGVISNGTQWRFMKLEDRTVTIDLMDYPLPPVEFILGMLIWIVREG
ncbi:hypothetical protein WA1_20600 [Scytonema hofmannii PCC 7110]|uniref:Uncharacterized protein n=1 Tax=Scytonema hofmannii PCC 7110 TaxID=128403 RepID=A0A139XCF0_9CYAN|nr:hypothetical protein [Scytonema hofmannii]KYC42371.1 hypothetical protein WA1_20600 [Scytonema hofmannii PCC 7110]